jgi:hypothetical protein
LLLEIDLWEETATSGFASSMAIGTRKTMRQSVARVGTSQAAFAARSLRDDRKW